MKIQRTTGIAGALLTLIAALLLAMQPSPGLAQQPGAFADRRYPFTDLPGVTTQDEAEAADAVVCTQTFDTDDNRMRRFGVTFFAASCRRRPSSTSFTPSFPAPSVSRSKAVRRWCRFSMK